MNIEATIIVMVYKNLNQVIQTLDSIKKQTYSNGKNVRMTIIQNHWTV